MNRVNRENFIDHLEAIYANGLITNVVLGPNMEATALTENRLFFVDAPAPDGFENVFGEDVGILDLSLLLRILRSSDADEVGIGYADNRIHMDLPDSTGKILTGEVEMTNTRVKDRERTAILSHLDQDGDRISASAIHEIQNWISLIKADNVEFRFDGREAECFIGQPHGHHATVNIPSTMEDEDHTTKYSANVLTSIINLIDPARAEWVFTGADSMCGIKQDGFTWVMSPIEE